MKNLLDVSLRTSLLAAAFTLTACAGHMASANLESRSGSSVTGTGTFAEKDNKVTLTLDIAGATPGKHGAHIHETGDCSAPNASSAGGHWNPATKTHGTPDPAHHLGDLGNIDVGADGKGKLTLSREWTVGDGSATDVVGKALVIHASEDDLMTDPAGNSGDRQACGVIGKK